MTAVRLLYGLPSLIAQAATDLPAPWGATVTWGGVSLVLGSFGYLFITGKFIRAGDRDRESARADRAETQRDELQKTIMSDTVPVLTKINLTMVPTLEKLTAELAKNTAELARMSERLDRLERQRAGN